MTHNINLFDILLFEISSFAQFFIAPLFTESATDKEVNAIESENSNNLLKDVWRISQLKKSLSKKGHPYAKFGTGMRNFYICILVYDLTCQDLFFKILCPAGNKVTLVERPKEKGICVRSELLKFHSKWYSSNIMSLIVLGKGMLSY